MAKILIVDDHNLFRAGLSMLLLQNEHVTDVFEAGSVFEAESTQCSPDLVLLDLQLPGITGIEGINVLKKRYLNIPIIILSASDDLAVIRQAAANGAMGFLNKSATAEQIQDALKSCLSGDEYFPSLQSLHDSINDNAKLTTRQLQVLELLCEGKSNKLIARALDLSENTVRVHVSAILNYFSASTRGEAALLARQKGIIH